MKRLKSLSMMLLCAAMSLSFTACSDDEDDTQHLSQNELSLIAGQSAKLIYNGDCTWVSDEPLIAEVDNNGNVTANRVGETTIWANDESCKVIVTPKYNTYMEPYIEWGASKNAVKSFMNGYEFVEEENNQLSYIDYTHNFGYIYMFENNSLYASSIGANFISKGEEITDFLLERYVVIDVDESSYTAYMASIDKKIAVAVSLIASNGLMMVIYMPFDVNSANTRSTVSKLNRQIIQNNVIEQTSIDINSLNDLLDKFKK